MTEFRPGTSPPPVRIPIRFADMKMLLNKDGVQGSRSSFYRRPHHTSSAHVITVAHMAYLARRYPILLKPVSSSRYHTRSKSLKMTIRTSPAVFQFAEVEPIC